MPGIGTTSSPWAWTHASATCPGVAPLRAATSSRRATPGQVALAWVHAQGDDVVPIPGTKRRRYLEENAAAADLKLTAQDLEEIGAAGTAQGDRYADMSPVNR